MKKQNKKKRNGILRNEELINSKYLPAWITEFGRFTRQGLSKVFILKFPEGYQIETPEKDKGYTGQNPVTITKKQKRIKKRKATVRIGKCVLKIIPHLRNSDWYKTFIFVLFDYFVCFLFVSPSLFFVTFYFHFIVI